jgi:hypothetical protein
MGKSRRGSSSVAALVRGVALGYYPRAEDSSSSRGLPVGQKAQVAAGSLPTAHDTEARQAIRIPAATSTGGIGDALK